MPVEAKKDAEDNTNTMAQRLEETVAMDINSNGVTTSKTDINMDEGKQALPQSTKASDPQSTKDLDPQSTKASDPKPARKRITPIAIEKP